MKIKILHYYGETPPVPEAVLAHPSAKMVNQPIYEVEIPEDGLLAFAEKHGSIILSPPSKTPFFGEWFIWVTSSDGRFTQR